MKLLFSILLILLTTCNIFGQDVLKGKVVDENFQPIPFVDVFLRGPSNEYRIRTDVEGEYLLNLVNGSYKAIFQATGYETKEIFLTIHKGENTQNVQMLPMRLQDIEEVEISGSKKNPGREIILKVVRKKDSLDFNQYPYRCQVYIKATEKIDRIKGEEKSSKKKKKEETDTLQDNPKNDFLWNFNMVEVGLERNYAPYNQVRELRNAFEQRGSRRNYLYFTTTAKSNFNFFKNTLFLDDLNESPIPSPISTVGILSYKYKLVEVIEVDSVKTFKIEIKARSSATSTLSGFIYVRDQSWMVERLELTLEGGNLYMYDYFTIEQNFDISSDSLCVLKDQVMTYGVNHKESVHTCKTTAKYYDYNFDVVYPPKYFGNEVAVTTKDAYERDSSYWSSTRTEPLTPEEIEYVRKKDSIYTLTHSKAYLDSIDSVINKITYMDVFLEGVDHINREKGVQWVIGSLASMVQPVYIAGPRLGGMFWWDKKWENEKRLHTYTNLSYGFLNQDIKGRIAVSYLYDPFKSSRIGGWVSHDYGVIRSNDGVTNMILRENFIERTSMSVYHNYEILNGLMLNVEMNFTERRSVAEGTNFIQEFDEVIGNKEPTKFNTYQALLAKVHLSYTPFQKYMTEPNRKVILGSRWPTFYAYWEKGVPVLFGSDVNHDYLLLGMRQSFKISTFGTSSYHIKTGKFLNTKVLREIDYKYHRRSDPIYLTNPLTGYQDLDTSLPTLNWYFESHFIHHFNGALLNKVPLMKRTRITSVAGGGFLYVPEHNWTHYEMFAGIERVIKLKKQRFRAGIYYVVSDGNHINPRSTFRISMNFLDPEDMTFWY